MHHRYIARLCAWFTLAIMISGLLVTGTATEAAAAEIGVGSEEAAFVTDINHARTRRGLAPLAVDMRMTSAARDWSEDMTSRSVLEHATDISSGAPSDWRKVGENVGRGGSVDGLFTAFMESPLHAANLLDPSFTRVGVGVVLAGDGTIYTTHRFAMAASDANRATRTCMGRAVTIFAVPGHPVIGTKNADVIMGTSGNDEIWGRGGNDIICGGAGDDIISGGRGRDRIKAGKGNDIIRGNSGNDLIRGGAGSDRLEGNRGSDSIRGGASFDRCVGGAGTDRFMSCDEQA